MGCIISKDFFPVLFLVLVSNSTPCDQNPTLHDFKICSGPSVLVNVPHSLKRMKLGGEVFYKRYLDSVCSWCYSVLL